MFTIGNAITLGLALLAVASTWGALSWRMGRVERDVEGHADRLNDIIESREKQGKRIGVVEGSIERLFERTDGPAARRRSSTLPVSTDGDDS